MLPPLKAIVRPNINEYIKYSVCHKIDEISFILWQALYFMLSFIFSLKVAVKSKHAVVNYLK
jgi:hypothetical protein